MIEDGKLQRRALLGGLGALIGSASVSQGWAQTGPSQTRFGAVAVDMSPLLQRGGAGVASRFEPLLLAKMQQVFGDKLAAGDRRAPVLVARISHLFLTSYADTGLSYSGDNDSIEGDGIVMVARQIVSTTHVLTELSPSYSGNMYAPDIDQRRLDSLAYQFAYWLRREMNI